MVRIEDNGEPGCKTSAEVNQRFRNFEDPTSYWQCGLQGEPAKAVRCEPNKLYSEEEQKCIFWKNWHWMDPKEPPSRPSKTKTK
ncbi:PREDICTED: uncharacterized protein LOC108380533 [Rhagoletis zephyria]|uniref:uncharacterized protein LOC108380533 n=1 Tax=Rhagoletis zephyria TaxID=28612 RepID=UPI00081191F3|nr:PREDICTED: uncharacterized protein LOC108380533 [Rhagoletis zephyria]XP_036345623.1 uncharacterized protein LOC118754858 [Rhagoletis pomonella]